MASDDSDATESDGGDLFGSLKQQQPARKKTKKKGQMQRLVPSTQESDASSFMRSPLAARKTGVKTAEEEAEALLLSPPPLLLGGEEDERTADDALFDDDSLALYLDAPKSVSPPAAKSNGCEAVTAADRHTVYHIMMAPLRLRDDGL